MAVQKPQELLKSYQVRAFVRDPSKIPEHLKDKVEVFKGNVLEPDSVFDAVEGMDGVVILLGTRNDLAPTSDMSEGTRNILEAMRAKNVKEVSACMSAFLFYEPEKVPPRFVDINEDHKRMYEALRESGLNWVAVFPPHISDEPNREIVVEVNPKQSPGRAITKWDLGTFMVTSVFEPKFYKSVVENFILNLLPLKSTDVQNPFGALKILISNNPAVPHRQPEEGPMAQQWAYKV